MTDCPHTERLEGVCTACGDCLHEVILNRACFLCGTTELEMAKRPALIQPESLIRKR